VGNSCSLLVLTALAAAFCLFFPPGEQVHLPVGFPVVFHERNFIFTQLFSSIGWDLLSMTIDFRKANAW